MLKEFCGLSVRVIKSDRRTVAVQLRPNEIIVRSPKNITEKDIEAVLVKDRGWIEKHKKIMAEQTRELDKVQSLTPDEIRQLADKALKVIPERVRHYAPIVGVTYGRITIRNQRTCWGSCSSKGNLNFNCLLMLAPDDVVDSVVVHELCHRKQQNHSKAFYDEVYRVFPDYDRCKNWLKENGMFLMKRLP